MGTCKQRCRDRRWNADSCADVCNVLQNDAEELKEWTEIKLKKDASGSSFFDGYNIAQLWAAPKAWAFQIWEDE